jgi:hypothetical protein
MNRNTWAAIAATIAVAVVLALGFHVLGSPGTQRKVQFDLRTVRALAELAQQINQKWAGSAKVLPTSLEKFSTMTKLDSATYDSLGYHPKSNGQYELCAKFATDSRDSDVYGGHGGRAPWDHPKGDYCFQLDASQPVPQAPYYY